MPSPFRCAARRLLPLLALLAPLVAIAASPVRDAMQLVVVTAPTWDAPSGRLQAYDRTDHGWQAHGAAFAVALGRSGSAWGIGLHPAQTDGPQKQEGDGRSPAGVFTIGEAFGYAPRIDSGMPYRPMLASNYCMDVPDSPLYNRIVDAEVVGADAVEGSSEPMRLDLHNDGDRRYREGFVIEHNPRAEPGQGSCIFAHLWRTPGEATAGCTAMEPEYMAALLGWLAPAAHPLFVLLPEAEYRRLRESWGLPPLHP
ncbi:MAG: L,D-transpeptidase family protein [Stenotrophomonas sp.]